MTVAQCFRCYLAASFCKCPGGPYGPEMSGTMTEPEEQDRGYMSEEQDLTPFDIVDLLRSEKGDDQAKALEWLYPGQTVALVRHVLMTGQSGIATTQTLVLAGLFTSLCWAAQHVGNTLGMRLAWVGRPTDDSNKIVVQRVIPPGG